MDKSPLITIGLCCYNAADSIVRAINSAIAQDYPNIEIIIVDDVSTDNSLAVVKDAIKDVLHARAFQNDKNLGPGGTRARILSEAQGDFIAFFDDDDVSAPHRVRTQYERITSYEAQTGETLIACYASGVRLYPNGYTKGLQAIGSRPKIPQGTGMADRLLFFGGDQDCFYGSGTPTCSLMTRTDTLKTVGGFDSNFRRVEDLDFAIRLSIAGGHFIGCPETLFTQHATEGQDKSHDTNLAAELQLVEKHATYLKHVRRYTYARTWPRIRHAHFKRDCKTVILLLAKLWILHPIAVTKHILTTGPARLIHERKMNSKDSAS